VATPATPAAFEAPEAALGKEPILKIALEIPVRRPLWLKFSEEKPEDFLDGG